MGGGESLMALLTLGAQVSVGKDKQYVDSFKERSRQGSRLGMSKVSWGGVDNWKSRWVAPRKPESRDGDGEGTEVSGSGSK